MNKKKIITVGFLKFGIGHYLAHLTKYLQKDFDFETITFTHGAAGDPLSIDDTVIKTYIKKYAKIINPHGLRQTYTSTVNFFKYAQSADILNLHISAYTRLSSYIFIPGILSLKKSKKKIVFTIHDVLPFPEGETVSEYLKYYYNLSDAAIVGNEKEKKLLKKYFDYKNPIYIATHGIYDLFDLKKTSKKGALKKLNLDAQQQKMLFFGIMRNNKGLDLLIKALKIIKEKKLLKNPILTLALTIRADSFDPYQSLIKKLKLTDVVRVYTNTNGFDVTDIEIFFKAHDALVLPYTQASQSGVLNIAFAFKMPVILSTKFVENSKVNNKMGLSVNPSRPDAIAQAIVKFFEILPKQKSFFEKNIKEYSQKHSFKHTAEVYKKAFENIL